ncbi:MAG: hypothetical protein K2Q24_09895 [Chitinophagaceae bacterium]|jgi:uncharacterized membrane protein|nr:hypothetical protein [Chitinophagaceae bacterium]
MDAKTTAWVSYLWWIGWIISLVTSNNTNSKPSLVVFHLRQSLGLLAISTALWILNMMLIFGFSGWYWIYTCLSVVLFILWIIGLIAAVQGEEKPVPVLGPLFQQWFQFIK